MPDDLEQRAHLGAAFAEQPLDRAVDLGRLFRRGQRLERSGALLDAEVAEKFGLRDRSGHARAHAFGGERKGLEIDMGGQIDLARRLQRIDEGVAADRLQGVAGRALDVAVIDHQRRAALMHQPAAERQRQIVGAPFVDRADRRVPHAGRHELIEQRDQIVGDAERELAVRVDLDHALVPAVELLDRLVHRQCVEQLVGENDGGAVRHLVEGLMPHHRHVERGHGLLLALLQRRADLDQMHHDRGAECRHHLHRAQRIEHHGAAAGAELDQPHVLRLSHLMPGRRRPQTEQLAEHLADLRRGDEIAVAAERIARRVVAVHRMAEAQLHVLPHRHRPGQRDAPADFGFERRGRHVQARSGGRFSAAAMKAKPVSISGTDSSMPMVNPPQRNPSCGSGSRKNSQTIRAIE